jgi:hypothetical protein
MMHNNMLSSAYITGESIRVLMLLVSRAPSSEKKREKKDEKKKKKYVLSGRLLAGGRAPS